MAKRVFAGAVILFASLLLAPMAADARGMGAGRGLASGGFRALPAARAHSGARFSVRHRARHASFGRHDFRRPGFGPRSILGKRLWRVGDHYRHGRHGRGFGYGYGAGYGFGTYGPDAFGYGSTAASPYPVSTVAQTPTGPVEITSGIGGPLLLRHVCESEVQVVPATGGGDHEVTITRCRLYAQYPGQ